MAPRTLPARDLLLADGLPLTLQRCGAQPARMLQAWTVAEAAAGGAGEWALAAHPAFCMGIGPRKAPKTPYPMLAQLHRCGTATGAALRKIDHDRAGERLRVKAPIEALRPVLATAAREHRSAKEEERGEATATLAVHGRRLRQQRRRRLKHRRSGGGGGAAEARGGGGKKSKKSSRKRGKAPLWQDGEIRPAESEQQQLCMSTWRGQLSVGAPVVFSSCAPSSGGGAGGDDREARAQRVAVEATETSGAVRLRLGPELCVTAGNDGVRWP